MFGAAGGAGAGSINSSRPPTDQSWRWSRGGQMLSNLSSSSAESAGGSFAGGSFAGGSLPSIFSTIIAKRAKALPEAGRSGGSFSQGAIEPSYRSGRGAQTYRHCLAGRTAFEEEGPTLGPPPSREDGAA